MPHLLILAPLSPLGGSPGVRIWYGGRKMFPVHFTSVKNLSSACPSTPRMLGIQDQIVHCIERTLDMGNSTFI